MNRKKEIAYNYTIITLCLIGCFILLGIVGQVEIHSTVEGVVTEVNQDCVTVKITDENFYDFYGDGFSKGDLVKVTIRDQGTINTYDDEVIDVEKVESR